MDSPVDIMNRLIESTAVDNRRFNGAMVTMSRAVQSSDQEAINDTVRDLTEIREALEGDAEGDRPETGPVGAADGSNGPSGG